MAQTYKVRSIGGALVVTLPRYILKLVPLEAGEEVTFTVAKKGRARSKGLIIIESTQPKRKILK